MESRIEISNWRMEDSPRDDRYARISVELRYGGALGLSERAWFEIPREETSVAHERGEPWLVAFLPLALTLGQTLRLEGLPVDGLLLRNAERLMSLWCDWYQELSPVAIEADAQVPEEGKRPTDARTACLFSGGVDSFFTVLHSEEAGAAHVEDLLLIHGADIPIHNQTAFANVERQFQPIAEDLGRRLIPLATNLRKTRFSLVNWGDLGYGPFLAGAAHQLSPKYSEVLISAGIADHQLRPNGAHPLADPLYSTSETDFLHYGAEWTRYEKIGYLRSHPLALNNLRVCYETDDGTNCCRCLKCVLAMSILEVHGSLADSEAFTAEPLDLNLLRRTYISEGVTPYRNTQRYAQARGREDVAGAIEDAFRRTERIDRWLQLRWARKARAKLRRNPVARRLTGFLRPVFWRVGRWLNRIVP